ncbi:MAG: M48 family metallopeptidase [Gammaproteobacteria bacterium]
MFARGLNTVLLAAVILSALTGCASSPTGRRQLEFFSPQEMTRLGDSAYQQVRQQTPVSHDPAMNRDVDCVVRAITAVVPPPPGGGRWQVTVFKEDKTINAFALPGGKIGVYTGLLKVTRTPAQLAAVVGHEIGHVEARHPNARMSAEYATQTGLQLLGSLAGASGSAGSQQMLSLLGLGAQVGIILPFTRGQESEADLLGLQYMARAGFDPRQAIALWQNMARAGGTKPPEFLSTHPSDQNRIRQLEQHMPAALRLYDQARAQGRRPACNAPPPS